MAISRLLARLGFVRIERYGLVLTPEDRILSTRPAVLDDGLGSKIVGWHEGDLAAMELEHWAKREPAMPTKIVALPGMTPTMPPPVPRKATASVPITAPAPVQVAPPAAPMEDDDWEWEIAVAKARAEAADAIQAAPPVARQVILPAQRVTHVAAKPPMRMPSATERQPLPLRAAPTPPSAVTVLSKPDLEPTRVRPVMTLRAPIATPPPKKFDMAKTEPSVMTSFVPPKPPLAIEPARPTVQAPIPKTPRPSSKHEETIRTLAAPPAANDDRTDTAIALPPAPAVASSASRRVAARQR